MNYRPPPRHQRHRRNHRTPLALVAGVAVLMIVLAVVIAVAQNSTKATQTCTVAGKFATTDGGKPPQRIYQVETEQCGVVRVQDNALQGVWNSADLYASLREGKTYEITTVGWRIPWLSQFPTVTKVSPK